MAKRAGKKLSEGMIDGAMFLHPDFSRKEAIAWLSGKSPTVEEINGVINLVCEKWARDPGVDIRKMCHTLVRLERRWDAAMARHLDANERSMILTAEDFNTRVGPC